MTVWPYQSQATHAVTIVQSEHLGLLKCVRTMGHYMTKVSSDCGSQSSVVRLQDFYILTAIFHYSFCHTLNFLVRTCLEIRRDRIVICCWSCRYLKATIWITRSAEGYELSIGKKLTVVGAPALEVFNARWDGALSNLIWWKMCCPWLEG